MQVFINEISASKYTKDMVGILQLQVMLKCEILTNSMFKQIIKQKL